MKRSVYMKVSMDEFELPVCVADTAIELAQMCGVNAASIYSSISHAKRGLIRSPYRKVDIIEEDEDVQ